MLGGMIVLGIGGVLAALATVWMGSERLYGLLLALLAFSLIGLGVSACGTSLLTLMAKRVPEHSRASAATAVWMMMILGFAVSAGIVGRLIEPYSPDVLLKVSVTLSFLTIAITMLSLHGLEGEPGDMPIPLVSTTMGEVRPKPSFKQAFATVWEEKSARTFTVFVFLSMLAYSAQDLILEPFAGAIHGFTPGQTTQLSGWHHMGVLGGMFVVALAGNARTRGRLGTVQGWMVGGCLASALASAGLSWAALSPAWPLKFNVVMLGLANGAFSIAAITTMMRLASEGGPGREGTRMGLWGAAQAVAFGLGGLLGTGASDLAHAMLSGPRNAYASVFALQSVLFAVSAIMALRLSTHRAAKGAGQTSVMKNSFERI
jgi:BCD family chlorophyll transporter-like MFS transporter